ncbi:hypothetical protein AVEN_131978-1 [Araneus ventricosus]|uniref:DDE-1 domain-containing protein n=1 Tax=Araneus ventricosus TaxID=182803 RepID=A0A4Y2B344_ARAVE|nr:hypothetical protein AVEN_131978-1 [Araneus ventricosus]
MADMSFFTDCLKGLDDKIRKQKRRIILFNDQCPDHPPDTAFLKNITVKFFLVNCARKLQPQDLGVIKSLKQLYRKLLAKTAISSLDHVDSKNMKTDVLKAYNDGVAKCFTGNDKKLLRPWRIFSSRRCQSH